METTIGEIVAKDIRKADVFKKYGMDFCCGGKKAVAQACREKGVDMDQLEKELSVFDDFKGPSPSQNYYTWELDFLADYIVNTHHRYVLQSSPLIFQYTQKVAKVHGAEHPEVVRIAECFLAVMDELNRHMMKEENILFPYIRELVQAKRHRQTMPSPPFGTIQNPIRMMEMEHEHAGDLVKEIERLSSAYQPPAGACTTYRLSYAKLEEFAADLYQHIHLENNILFPAAIALEKELLGEGHHA